MKFVLWSFLWARNGGNQIGHLFEAPEQFQKVTYQCQAGYFWMSMTIAIQLSNIGMVTISLSIKDRIPNILLLCKISLLEILGFSQPMALDPWAFWWRVCCVKADCKFAWTLLPPTGTDKQILHTSILSRERLHVECAQHIRYEYVKLKFAVNDK